MSKSNRKRLVTLTTQLFPRILAVLFQRREYHTVILRDQTFTNGLAAIILSTEPFFKLKI